MDKNFIKSWEDNKHKLEKYFMETPAEDYNDSYKMLLEKLIEHCELELDYKNIVEIDHGCYQGTLLFIIPEHESYVPDIEDYAYTYVYYGSCSVCDTLQGVDDSESKQGQVKQYMTICLHMVQKLKWFVNRETV